MGVRTPLRSDRIHQYRALVEKQIPRDADSHRGHDIEEPITFWSGDQIGPRCIDCGVTIERPPDG